MVLSEFRPRLASVVCIASVHAGHDTPLDHAIMIVFLSASDTMKQTESLS